MSEFSIPTRKRPWHLFVVAVLTLLWNGAGAYTIFLAQAGRLADVDAEETTYYATKPLLMVISTDLALVLPIAAAVALLFRSKSAVWLFGLSAGLIICNNVYEIAVGTSLASGDQGWSVLTTIIVGIALLQFAYAWAMRRGGVLQ